MASWMLHLRVGDRVLQQNGGFYDYSIITPWRVRG